MATGRSLWDRVPRDVRLELVPIASTALLTQAGAATAEALVRLRNGVPYGQRIDLQPVNDLAGLFILCNFAVVFWFGYQALKNALANNQNVSLNARIIGLASAFVTTFELYSYALKTGQPERLIYAIVVLFYVFFVPFLLMRESKLPTSFKDDEERRRNAVQAFLGMELIAHALIPCVAGVIVGSLYFAILNDGVALGGITIVPSIVKDWLGISDRAEFWGFSPGILGVGWLQAVILTAEPRASEPEQIRFGLNERGRKVVFAATIAINIILALVLIGDRSMAGVSGATPAGWSPEIAKAVLAIAATAAFLAAFMAARALERRTKALPIGFLWLLQTLVFAVAGAAVGWVLVGLRRWLGDGSPLLWHLIWMHAAGFALVYLAGMLATILPQRWLKHVPAVIGFRQTE